MAFTSYYRSSSQLICDAIHHELITDKISHVEKLAKSAEEAAFVGDKWEVYIITKKLVTNMKADPPVLDRNGNILSTDEGKLNRWREHFGSVLNHVVSSDVSPFAPTTETISPARSIPQTPKSEIVSAIKSIPSGKAAGMDGIPAEFYKSNL